RMYGRGVAAKRANGAAPAVALRGSLRSHLRVTVLVENWRPRHRPDSQQVAGQDVAHGPHEEGEADGEHDGVHHGLLLESPRNGAAGKWPAGAYVFEVTGEGSL